MQEEWIYVKRPGQEEVSETHYSLRKTEKPSLADGDSGMVILRTLFVSVDPYHRIQQSAKNTWEDPHPLGEVQGGGAVLQVEESKSDKFKAGDIVSGYTGWRRYVKCADTSIQSLEKLENANLPVSYALSVCGMPARTAFFGLNEAGKPKEGETVVVSGAAGAVGSIVVQLAKIKGCRVVAIAGTKEKLDWLKELGADQVINYKEHKDQEAMEEALKKAAPSGIDVYFDNVGGHITDAVLCQINVRARVIICGQISQYNGFLDSPSLGPRFLHRLIYTRATIQGILARDYSDRMDECVEAMVSFLSSGRLKYKETVVSGFEKIPQALNSLFHGSNTGKLVVKVSERE